MTYVNAGSEEGSAVQTQQETVTYDGDWKIYCDLYDSFASRCERFQFLLTQGRRVGGL